MLTMMMAGLALAFANSAAQDESETWRPVEPEYLILIETDHGEVAVELAPQFAPLHAQRMRTLARVGFYDGLSFYRVIEGFVAQAGREEGGLPDWPGLPLEAEVETGDLVFTPLGNEDLYAPRIGHIDGFAAAQSEDARVTWPIYCPGVMGMARNADPKTGDTEFFIVIGHGPRHLDRNYSAFGRVIDGMEHIQALHRGEREVEAGVIQDKALRDPIHSIRLASDLPEDVRPSYEVMRTESAEFAALKEARRVRSADAFVVTPPEIIEACHIPGPVRRVD